MAERRGRGDRGAAMIEFALAFVVLATIVLGAIDLGRAFATWNQVKNAAREGAAYAERDPWSQSPAGSACTDPDNITHRAQHEGGDLRPELVVATKRNGTTYAGCQTPGSFAIAPGDTIAVTVSTPFEPISPFGGMLFGNPTIRAEVEVVVQ
jgi:Flp pilus assembly pilin Flp